MLFSSVTFIYLFLPIVLGIYYISPRKYKNLILFLASLFFYFWGEPRYTILLLLSSLWDFFISLYIEQHRDEKKATYGLILSCVLNLGLLGYFKYLDFFISNTNTLLGISIPLQRIVMPIGISFFTFQTLSYTIDVYRGKVKVQKNFITFATFVSLFPQLIAGPIVRYADVQEELEHRRITVEEISYGIRRFIIGLSKKVVLANQLGFLATTLLSLEEKTVIFYWFYAIAYTLQIYYDFSGYSDMAIGLGSMLGFHFPENFSYPYFAKSIAEFWRRWHMTLGSWFRDYVYIPLGGNRVSILNTIRNLSIVWLLTGFWHGASWNFIIWGGYFGVLLIVEKFIIQKYIKKIPSILAHLYLMVLVTISFVIFSQTNLVRMGEILGGMFGMDTVGLIGEQSKYYLDSYKILLCMAFVGVTPFPKKAVKFFSKYGNILEPIFLAFLLLLSTAYLVDSSFNPFLYFRF